jgi:hypothetical protein
VWQPDKEVIRRRPTQVATQNGYRTTHTNPDLWRALGLELNQPMVTCVALVTPTVYRFEKGTQILLDYTGKDGKPLTYFYLTHNVAVNKWTEEEAREHMTNETMLLFRKHITLQTKKKNPIANWGDVTWQYDLHQPSPSTCFITWTPLIKYNEDIFKIKRHSQIRWTSIPETLETQWPKENINTPNRWSLSGTDRSFLLGSNPPNQIPDKDTSAWLPSECTDATQHQDDQSGTEEDDPLIEDAI